MGKKLIIKGADFSVNGITPPHVDIDWIGLSKTPTKYISSGISLKATTRLIIDFTTKVQTEDFPSTTDRGGYIGANLNITKCMAMLVSASKSGTTINNALRVVFGRDNGETNFIAVRQNILDGSRHSFEINSSGYILDGVTSNWPDSHWNNNGSGSNIIYLDSSSYSSGASIDISYFPTYPDLIKVHRIRIYDDATTLVFDGVPVQKNDQNNTICYYDRVSDGYFGRNDGSEPCNSVHPNIDQPSLT